MDKEDEESVLLKSKEAPLFLLLRLLMFHDLMVRTEWKFPSHLISLS